MSLPEKLKLLLNGADADELSYSERLWPYPFDAHDVPDFGNLNSWVDDSLEDEDLKFHIENSINCIRALQLLLEESGVEYQEPTNAEKTSFERVLELMKSTPIDERKSDYDEPPRFKYHGAPKQYLLYNTKSKLPILVDGTIRYSYNFDPPMVLLVNDGKESDTKKSETLFRGVPASFSEDYPVNQMDSDQILVGLKDGRRIVLHLSLNYPVSSEQLDDAVGSVPDSEQEKVRVGISAVLQGIPLMPADGAGIGPSEEMAEIVALERERIVERSQTLAAFADFNLQQAIQLEASSKTESIATKVKEKIWNIFSITASDEAPDFLNESYGLRAEETPFSCQQIYRVEGCKHHLLVQFSKDSGEIFFSLEGETGANSDLDGFSVVVKSTNEERYSLEGGQLVIPINGKTLEFNLLNRDGDSVPITPVD